MCDVHLKNGSSRRVKQKLLRKYVGNYSSHTNNTNLSVSRLKELFLDMKTESQCNMFSKWVNSSLGFTALRKHSDVLCSRRGFQNHQHSLPQNSWNCSKMIVVRELQPWPQPMWHLFMGNRKAEHLLVKSWHCFASWRKISEGKFSLFYKRNCNIQM
jgi:hypothetical protein